VLGAIAQFEKATTVAKLKAARDRKIAAGEKCGGRKSYAEARPEMVELARQLRRPDPDRRPVSCGRSRRPLPSAAMSRQPASRTKLRLSRLCFASRSRRGALAVVRESLKALPEYSGMLWECFDDLFGNGSDSGLFRSLARCCGQGAANKFLRPFHRELFIAFLFRHRLLLS
jgi:hypothetical protein